MNDQLVAAVEDEHNRLKWARFRIETDPKFALRRAVIIQRLNAQGSGGYLDYVLGGDTMLGSA